MSLRVLSVAPTLFLVYSLLWMQNCLWGQHGKALMFLNLSPEASSLPQSKTALEFGTKVNNTEIGPARRQMGTLA